MTVKSPDFFIADMRPVSIFRYWGVAGVLYYVFLAYFAVNTPIPPLITYIPFKQLLVINSVLLGGALLAAAIPALIVSRLETGKILRRE